ncbi:hypothetical protein FE257_003068 [Aspergillus nanangensis]|uniref:Uncharacterized protein n=1 Tax=Aspergillus nanangensis TaxID=2582783 RepID=A0AAD4CC10_ASPNN|nr:hypothetical protein FE257_003068 [Aspergillus nanangensis]
MSLNSVSEGLNSSLSNNDPAGVSTEGIIPPLNGVADDPTNLQMPGDFPTGKTPDDETREFSMPPLSSFPSIISTWIKGAVPTTADLFEIGVKRFALWICPPQQQLAVYEATVSHPIAATFVICQLICCGVPILVFLAGTFLFLAVCILLWAVLSLLILGPVLLVASTTGVYLWTWGWIVYGFIKLTDKLFLGGMLTRLWLSQAEQYGEGLKHAEEKESESERQHHSK